MANHFSIFKETTYCMCTPSLFTQLPLLSRWMNYTRIYFCAVKSCMVIFIILDSSKKKKNVRNKINYTKEKKSVGTMIL